MSTQPEETEESSGSFLSRATTLFSPLIFLALLFIATLVTGLGVVLVGRIVSQIFGLTLFEASLISLGAAFGVVYAFVQILRPPHTLESIEPDWDEDDYDEDEDFEDEENFVDMPPPKSSLTDQLPRAEPTPGRNAPCWCGSGKKYKNCHGR
jgi:hypothetical protein